MKQDEVQVPTCYTGHIITLPPLSFCMDGVRHAIVTRSSEKALNLFTIRIKGRNPTAQAEIERWADTKSLIPIRVCGYTTDGPERSYLSVYSVETDHDHLSVSGRSSSLAQINPSTFRAFFASGSLLIMGQAIFPNPHYSISIEIAPYKILPPLYEVRSQAPPGTSPTGPVVEREIFNVFRGPYQENVTLFHATGKIDVAVQQLILPTEKTKPAKGSLAEFAALLGGGEIPIPFRLNELRKNSATNKPHQIAQGEPGKFGTFTGYSNNLSFDEALQDAIKQVPWNPHTADELIHAKIIDSGIHLGGIAGLRQLYVTIFASL